MNSPFPSDFGIKINTTMSMVQMMETNDGFTEMLRKETARTMARGRPENIENLEKKKY